MCTLLAGKTLGRRATIKSGTMSSHMEWCWGLFLSPCFPVVLELFLQSIFYAGTIKTVGIMVKEISTSLNTTSTDLGIILGLFSLCSSLPALFFSLVYKHIAWQYRRVPLVLGSVMLSSGVILASCASNKIQMAVFLAISGTGQCAVLINLDLILNEISDHYNLLHSIAQTGYGVGMVIPPLVAQLLLETYGWRGAMLIIGALMANMIPCASIIRVRPGIWREKIDITGQSKPMSQDQKDFRAEAQPLIEREQEHNDRHGVDKRQSKAVKKTTQKKRNMISSKPCVYRKEDLEPELKHIAIDRFALSRQSADCSECVEKKYLGSSPIEDERKSFDQESSVPLLMQSKAEITESLSRSSDVSEVSAGECQDKHSVIKLRDLKDKRIPMPTFGIGIYDAVRNSMFFTDPWINLMFLSLAGIGYVYSGWHFFLIPDALQRGISPYRTLFITLFAAIGNVLGRVLVGVLTQELVNPVSLYLVMCLIEILTLLVYSYVTNIFLMVSLSFGSALIIAGRASLTTIVVRERVSIDQFGVAYAVVEFIMGLGDLLGGFMSGMIADRFSSYHVTFKFLAVVDVLVLLLMLPIKLVKKPPKEAT